MRSKALKRYTITRQLHISRVRKNSIFSPFRVGRRAHFHAAKRLFSAAERISGAAEDVNKCILIEMHAAERNF